ncbi:hypothetical protein TNCV_3130571 [Trichonephila clavipes]|nr:hypothetical protein TNCV_3130571 [Trichonephila clavipes]
MEREWSPDRPQRGRHNKEDQFNPEKADEGTIAPTSKNEQDQATGMPGRRSCHSLCICAVNSPVSRDGCSCLPSASRHALLVKDLVTWQAMVGRHILKKLLGESRSMWMSIILLINGTWAT